MRARLLLCIALGLSGCAHRVLVTSEPAGASVRFKGKGKGVTPVEFTTVWWPLRRMPVKVKLEGHRTVSMGIGRDVRLHRLLGEILMLRVQRLAGTQVRTTHEVLLIPQHGAAGTWTPEDIDANR